MYIYKLNIFLGHSLSHTKCNTTARSNKLKETKIGIQIKNSAKVKPTNTYTEGFPLKIWDLENGEIQDFKMVLDPI